MFLNMSKIFLQVPLQQEENDPQNIKIITQY